MVGRQERLAILLLLGVAVAVISAHLVLGTIGKKSFAHPFTEDSANGELVVAQGVIEQIVYTKNGGHMNVYLNKTLIFIPEQIAQELILSRGDSISVYGVVQTYRGKKEIVLGSGEDISVIAADTKNR